MLEQAPHAEHGNWLPQAQMLAPPSMPPAAAVSNVGMGAGTGGDAALPRMLPLTSTVRSRRRSVTKQLVCSRGLTHDWCFARTHHVKGCASDNMWNKNVSEEAVDI